MAETIGRAYIKILADGTGLSESIQREMDRVKPVAEDGGRDFSKSYAKGYEEEEKKSQNFSKSLSRTLNKGFAEMEHEAGKAGARAGAINADRMRLNIENRLRKSFPDLEHMAEQLGGSMGDAMRKDFIRKGNFTKDFESYLSQALRDVGRWEKAWRVDFEKAGADIEKFRGKARDSLRDAHSHISNVEDDMRRLNAHIEDGVQVMENWGSEMRQGIGFLGRWGRKIEEGEGFLGKFLRSARNTEPFFHRFQGNLDRVATGIGKLFGKGSRNNFVNWVGSMVQGLAQIFTKTVPQMLDYLIKPFQQAQQVFEDVRAEGGSMLKALTNGAGAFALSAAELPATLIGIGAAAAIAATMIGPLISALWLLLGAVTALISSISFGLMGLLAPLVGLLAPVGIAAGAVAAAFIGMDNKTKKLMKEAIEPLKKDLQDLGDAARPGILKGLQTAVENLHQPIKQLEPLFAAAGDGVATFMGAFTDAMTGPGFTKFVNIMTRRLPTELGQLGDAMGHVFDGFLGALGDLNRKGGPVDQFLTWLDKIAQQFDDWTTMKVAPPKIDLAQGPGGGMGRPGQDVGGQTGFQKFMSDIQTSAEALKGVLGPLWKIIQQIMGAGKPAGDSMMVSLGDSLTRLSDWITKHPDDVSKWFSDSKDFAKALGDLAVAMAQLAAALDSPEGRFAATWLLKLTSLGVSSGGSQLSSWIGPLHILSAVPWDKIGEGLKKLKDGFDKIRNIKLPTGIQIHWTDIINIPAGLSHIVQSLIVRAFTGLPGLIRKAMGHVDVSGIISGTGRVAGVVLSAFRGLATQALRSMGVFSILDIINNLGKVTSEIFRAFPSASEILHSIGTFDIMDVIDGLASVASNIFAAFPSASEILTSIGHIDLGSLMHGSIDPPGPLGPWSWGSGGIVAFPQRGLVGEAGPEAIVPLARPLSMVDPAVRELAAIAQGMSLAPNTQAPATRAGIDVGGITIITPTRDPAAVAQEAINRLVAVGY